MPNDDELLALALAAIDGDGQVDGIALPVHVARPIR